MASTNQSALRHVWASEDAAKAPTQRRSNRACYDNDNRLYDMTYHPLDSYFRRWSFRRTKPTSHNGPGTMPSPQLCQASGHNGRAAAESLSKHTSLYQSSMVPQFDVQEDMPVSHSQYAGSRRSSRLQHHDKSMIYNSRYHPADDILRPLAAANLKKSLSASSMQPKGEGQIPRLLSKKSRPEASDLRGTASTTSAIIERPKTFEPALAVRVCRWADLAPNKQLLIKLQKGAPLSGPDATSSWRESVQKFVELVGMKRSEDRIALDDLQSTYEIIRVGLEQFFEAKAEVVDSHHWEVFKTEALSVYEAQRGRQYWRHYEESIVKPYWMKVSYPCRTSPPLSWRLGPHGGLDNPLVLQQVQDGKVVPNIGCRQFSNKRPVPSQYRTPTSEHDQSPTASVSRNTGHERLNEYQANSRPMLDNMVEHSLDEPADLAQALSPATKDLNPACRSERADLMWLANDAIPSRWRGNPVYTCLSNNTLEWHSPSFKGLHPYPNVFTPERSVMVYDDKPGNILHWDSQHPHLPNGDILKENHGSEEVSIASGVNLRSQASHLGTNRVSDTSAKQDKSLASYSTVFEDAGFELEG